jgi:heptosyltransferase-2
MFCVAVHWSASKAARELMFPALRSFVSIRPGHSEPPSRSLQLMRIGVFLPNWIGDVVMATPALRALRTHFARPAHIVGVMRPYVADVLAGTSWLDSIVYCERRSVRPKSATRMALEQLRAERLDLALLLTNSFRTAWMAWRCGARERIGYVGELRGWLLTERLPAPPAAGHRDPLPTIDGYLQLAAAAGCASTSRRLELATTAADDEAADAVWRRLGLPTGNQVIVLNSGGAFGKAKYWPGEYFAALAQRIVEHTPYSVLINCGPAERDTAREIVALAGSRRVTSLADVADVPVGLTKACIRRSRMLVTTDSGPRFFGVAFNKPVVTLFGPTDPKATRTGDGRELSLSLSLDCQPCMKRTCPLGHHRCMRELTVDRVYAAVMQQLALPAEPQRAA